MKKQILHSAITVTFIAAIAFLTYAVSADQMKGGQRLLNQPAVSNPAPAVAAKPHDCAQCKDVTKEIKLATSKGACNKTAMITEHACPTCETRIKTEGQGKAAHSVAVHTCASGMTPSCCQ